MTLSQLGEWLAATEAVLVNEPKRAGENWVIRACSPRFDGSLNASADDYETAVETVIRMVDARLERLALFENGVDA